MVDVHKANQGCLSQLKRVDEGWLEEGMSGNTWHLVYRAFWPPASYSPLKTHIYLGTRELRRGNLTGTDVLSVKTWSCTDTPTPHFEARGSCCQGTASAAGFFSTAQGRHLLCCDWRPWQEALLSFSLSCLLWLWYRLQLGPKIWHHFPISGTQHLLPNKVQAKLSNGRHALIHCL